MDKDQKGFSPIVLIIAVGVLVFIGAFAVRYFQKGQVSEEEKILKQVEDWTLYKEDPKAKAYVNELSCRDKSLEKEYNSYVAMVQKDGARSLAVLRGTPKGGNNNVTLVATKNYFKWPESKITDIQTKCFFEPYVNAPAWIYPDEVLFVITHCAGAVDTKEEIEEAEKCQIIQTEIGNFLDSKSEKGG